MQSHRILFAIVLVTTGIGTAVAESCTASCSNGSCSISTPGEDQAKSLKGPVARGDGSYVLAGTSEAAVREAMFAFAKRTLRQSVAVVDHFGATGIEILAELEIGLDEQDWLRIMDASDHLELAAVSNDGWALVDRLTAGHAPKSGRSAGVSCNCSPTGYPSCRLIAPR